jgi:hypothetical protein
MQKLLNFICESGFEHHVAANFSLAANSVYPQNRLYNQRHQDTRGVSHRRRRLQSDVSGAENPG